MTSPCGLTLSKEAAFASHTSCNFSIYSRKRVKARAFGLVLMHELHVIMILLVIFHTNRCLVKSINNINYQVFFFFKCHVFVFNSWELKVSEFTPNVRQKRLKRFLSESRFLAVFGPSNCCRGVDLLFRESQITVEWLCGFSLPEWHMRRKWKQKLLLVFFLIVVIKLALLQGFTTFPRVPFGQLAEQELRAAVRMGHRGGSTTLKLHLSCCCLHFLKEWKCFRFLFM